MRSISLFLIFLVASMAFGQQESIRIGPGDEIHINVFDTPELSQDVHVNDHGEITLLMGGEVKLGSLSPALAAAAIEAKLAESKVMRRPKVAVTITQYATQAVSVLGQVNHPGAYKIMTPRPILDVLTEAGGLTDLANRQLTIERRATGDKLAYYVSNNAGDALDTEVLVYPGDTVIVPRVGVIYVLGDVGRPGAYPLATNDSKMTLMQVIALAGGTNKTAVPAHTRLLQKTEHGYSETTIQLSAVQKGKAPDQFLAPDDIIYVPFSYLRNFAIGADGLVAAAASAAVYHY
jgi:polysaccharide export outer membrane protein